MLQYFYLTLSNKLVLVKKEETDCTFMIKNNVNGKCFVVIKNMYENIKSCVTNSGNYSVFFPCRIGVRQGENLRDLLMILKSSLKVVIYSLYI